MSQPPSWPLALRAYSLATRMLTPLAPLFLRYRAKLGKEDPERLGERLGRPALSRPAGRLAWLHGASVGEGLALLPLVTALQVARPDITVLVTCGTVTAAKVLADRAPSETLLQFAPLDTPSAVAGFLDHWKPSLGVFVESELWPNLMRAAKARGVRLALISGRLSERSARRWTYARGALQSLLGAFDLLMARDAGAAAVFAGFGIECRELADLKFGAPPLPVSEAAFSESRAALSGRPVLFAASTHAGEETIIIAAFRIAIERSGAPALLIIAPRHPDRGEAILILAQGLPAARRGDGGKLDGVDIYVADTLGELGLWYRLATIAFIGGSLVPGVGGHNPLEPARLGCPFVTGPSTDGWPIYRDLVNCGGTRVVNSPEALAEAFCAALDASDPLAQTTKAAEAFTARGDLSFQAAAQHIMGLLPL